MYSCQLDNLFTSISKWTIILIIHFWICHYQASSFELDDLKLTVFNNNEEQAVRKYYQDYSDYIDSYNHVLFGYFTPVYLASLTTTTAHTEEQYKIVYKRLSYYPTLGDKIDFQKDRTKREKLSSEFGSENKENPNLSRESNNYKPQTKHKRDTSDTVYPEVLVVVDYETYKNYDGDISLLAAYVGAFWNGVDLLFREIHPKIRLNIAGLIIPTNKLTEPYLIRNASNGGYFDHLTLTLAEIGKYFENHTFHSHDIVAVMTSKNLSAENLYSFGKTEGFAFESSACTGSSAAMLIKDAGGFEGIHNAAYNLAKILGSSHDIVDSTNIFEGACVINKYENSWHWPNCSIKYMENYLKSESATCLRNKPDISIQRRKRLPGKLLNRDEQCKKIFPGFDGSYAEENNCDILMCKKCAFSNFICEYETHGNPPAEGSSCGDGLFCLNGKCIEDKEIFD